MFDMFHMTSESLNVQVKFLKTQSFVLPKFDKNAAAVNGSRI